ncbi:hypothetical protein GOODEAATRI_034097 [Goodea atripinnis]|uniref:Uncharacterized protein n=1 Tax=Goodea atripinnis TaxID=208336 RepID=A0ABV0PJC1_9TELE
MEEGDLWKSGGIYTGSVKEGGPLLPPFPLWSCAFIWVMAPQEVRSYPLFWLCRKKVNAFILKSSRKVCTGVLVSKFMAVWSQHPPLFSSEEWDEVQSLGLTIHPQP